MRVFLGIFILWAQLFSQPASLHAAQPVKVYTSVFPPIVTDNMHQPGYAYEILEALFAIANIEAEIIQLPWSRAQKQAQVTPEALIFPLTRTPTREEFFDWSFILFKTQTHFITLDGVKLTEETARERLIGVQRDSSWDNWLSEHNYNQVHRATNEGHALVRMLKAGRIDTWYAEKSIAQNILPINRVYNATFSDPILSFNTYLATNKQIPCPCIKDLKAAFKTLIESGQYHQIMRQYNVEADHVLPD